MTDTPEIICYSKTGHSRALAERITAALDGHLQMVTTPRYRWPVLGWLAAGRDGYRAVPAPLNEPLQLPGADGLVVIVGPVWVGKPAAPLNAIVDQLGTANMRVAAALTCADPQEVSAPLDLIEQRLGRALVARLVVANRHRTDPETIARVKAFALRSNIGEDWQG